MTALRGLGARRQLHCQGTWTMGPRPALSRSRATLRLPAPRLCAATGMQATISRQRCETPSPARCVTAPRRRRQPTAAALSPPSNSSSHRRDQLQVSACLSLITVI